MLPGGGFGGKESRFVMLAVPVAVAAHKLQRSVRCMLDRDEDMVMSGNRHPFYAKYKVIALLLRQVQGQCTASTPSTRSVHCFTRSAISVDRLYAR